MRKNIIFTLTFLINNFLFAQTNVNFPEDLFIPPVKIPIYLSGTFGELRSNHFHAGIDIKTGGETGKKIYTIQDGYVSRIHISTSGYGKSLYITHPNGYISVYGHLSRYNNKIEKYIKEYQYDNQTHTLKIFPDKSLFPVKKGDIIAYSGNSGYSFGPHLHFEIRKSKDHTPLNALLFNFDVKDNIKPKILGIAVYPANPNSYINGKNTKKIIDTKGIRGDYQLKNDDTLRVSGDIGFGIETYDYLNESNNKCGVYSIELKINNSRIYYHEIQEIPFHKMRFINTHIDYETKIKDGRKFQKSFISPNNDLSIYKNVVNNGIIHFSENRVYNIQYIVKDSYQNTSKLDFIVKAVQRDTTKTAPIEDDSIIHMKYDKENTFVDDGIKIKIPPYSLYDDLAFTYNKTDTIHNLSSSVYQVHDQYTPLHKYYSLSILPDSLDKDIKEKAVIATINEQGELSSAGGRVYDSYIKARVRNFGNFVIAVDTLEPTINPLNIYKDKDMSKETFIKFKVTDNLSGISSYNGYIDGEWALFEYNLKDDEVKYKFDKKRIHNNQKHEMELYVIDKKGNIAVYHNTFFY